MLSLTQKFDTFLEEEGILEQCEEVAKERAAVWAANNPRLSINMPSLVKQLTIEIAKGVFAYIGNKVAQDKRLDSLVKFCQTGDADYVIKGEGK
jgi:cytochrome b